MYECLCNHFPNLCAERVTFSEAAVTFGHEDRFRETLNLSRRRRGNLLNLVLWQTETESYT